MFDIVKLVFRNLFACVIDIYEEPFFFVNTPFDNAPVNFIVFMVQDFVSGSGRDDLRGVTE